MRGSGSGRDRAAPLRGVGRRCSSLGPGQQTGFDSAIRAPRPSPGLKPGGEAPRVGLGVGPGGRGAAKTPPLRVNLGLRPEAGVRLFVFSGGVSSLGRSNEGGGRSQN